MVVNYEDTDRNAAALICNAVVDSYLRQRDAYDNKRVSNLERWLDPEIDHWQQEVEDRQANVHSLSKATIGYAKTAMFGVGPGERAAVIEDQSNLALMTQLRSQIADLKVQLAIYDAQIAMKREVGVEEDGGTTVDLAVADIAVERQEPTEDEIAAFVSADGGVQEAEALVNRYRSVLLNLEDSDLVRVRREYYKEVQEKRDEWIAKLETTKKNARERVVAF